MVSGHTPLAHKASARPSQEGKYIAVGTQGEIKKNNYFFLNFWVSQSRNLKKKYAIVTVPTIAAKNI
jgi:hypothetical protein